jgi:hypothetical protein
MPEARATAAEPEAYAAPSPKSPSWAPMDHLPGVLRDRKMGEGFPAGAGEYKVWRRRDHGDGRVRRRQATSVQVAMCNSAAHASCLSA